MKYAVIPYNKDISLYKEFDYIILPIKDFSIGFDVYYNVEEINEISKINKVFLIANKFLHSNDLIKIKDVFANVNMNNIIKVFIEDFGLINVLGKDKIILYPNHVINNYNAINYYKEIGINDIVISNDLTYKEIDDIINNTSSVLYYFYIAKNTLMNSKRKLISNYKEYYKIDDNDKELSIVESVSKKEYLLKEENAQTIMLNEKVFCASSHFGIISKLDYLIINLNNIADVERNIIMNNFKDKNLHKMLECDCYFLDNEIAYKVGDKNA